MRTLEELSILCDNHSVELMVTRNRYSDLSKKWRVQLDWSHDGTSVKSEGFGPSHLAAFCIAFSKLETVIKGKMESVFLPALEHIPEPPIVPGTPLSMAQVMDDEIPF